MIVISPATPPQPHDIDEIYHTHVTHHDDVIQGAEEAAWAKSQQNRESVGKILSNTKKFELYPERTYMIPEDIHPTVVFQQFDIEKKKGMLGGDDVMAGEGKGEGRGKRGGGGVLSEQQERYRRLYFETNERE